VYDFVNRYRYYIVYLCTVFMYKFLLKKIK